MWILKAVVVSCRSTSIWNGVKTASQSKLLNDQLLADLVKDGGLQGLS